MDRIQKVALVLALIVVGSGAVVAQSNEVIDAILAEDAITYGNAAYLFLTAGGVLNDEATVDEAYEYLERGPENRSGANYSIGGASFTTARVPQTPLKKPADAAVTLGEFSLLTMETFNIPGGLMYTIFSSPRYAARELAFRDIVQGDAYPRMDVSGERALRIIGRVLALQESGRLR